MNNHEAFQILEFLDIKAMNEEKIGGLIQKAYNSLKEPDANQALLLLHDTLKLDYEHAEALFAMKCINWWLDRMNRLEDFRSSYEKGGFILSQWKSFLNFDEKVGIGEAGDTCRYALRRWVFSRALGFFRDTLGEGEHDSEVLYQIGRCYKGVGDYGEAVKYLEQAAGVKQDDAGILSELADVNALLGDARAAKVLFREAFFLDAQDIELSSLESEMIVRLIRKVEGLGYEGAELSEWIPVYGTLWGVFSIKKELKALELGKLKQTVMALEGDIRNGEKSNLLKPRLLNRYFRLVDYYEGAGRGKPPVKTGPAPAGRKNSAPSGSNAGKASGEDAAAEIMMKIKFIDEEIYKQYRN
ncbi:MAG: hypothetical protein LBH43_12880 [Treponema sp.]|jgi:tetratricopeptide (TPR) repeat protein|nr:hypothetical protein [Treponema sp.]